MGLRLSDVVIVAPPLLFGHSEAMHLNLEMKEPGAFEEKLILPGNDCTEIISK